jgi:hypothetical protein
MDMSLELKKPTSRETNDTDERLAARALYEAAINNTKTAVYTRDDDVRKLISATFKFLISRQMNDNGDISFIKSFLHLNIMVFKYDYEKKVFARFFESSNLPDIGDFRFPNRLTKVKVGQIISDAKDLLEQIQEYVNIPKPQPIEVKAQPSIQQPKVDFRKVLEEIFYSVSALKIKEDTPNCQLKVKLLENLALLSNHFECKELYDKVIQTKGQNERACIELIIAQLKEEKENLQKKHDVLYSQPTKNWQQIQASASANDENDRKLRFFENALKANMYNVTYQDYEYFQTILQNFQKQGLHIEESETLVPQEKICDVTNLSTAEIIQIIEAHKIRYESTHAYLSQSNLIFFCFAKKK